MNVARRLGDRSPLLRFGSLRQRIAVIYAGLFAVILAGVFLLANGAVTNLAEQSIVRDMVSNARVFDEVVAVRTRQMRSAGDVLAAD